jgi:NTE family protein
MDIYLIKEMIMPKYRNLVFEGGGAAGISYAGALKELEQLVSEDCFSLQDIQRVGGSSVGSITALLVCLNYTADEIAEKIKSIDLKTLKDDDFGVGRDFNRVIHEYGFYKGYALHELIKGFIKEKTGNENATFMDLKRLNFKDLYVTATKVYEKANVGTCKLSVFSWENAPDTPIAAIVLASASIPAFYKAVRLHEERPGFYTQSSLGHTYVDGGTLNNFPITLFDAAKYCSEAGSADSESVVNHETLGFRLVNPANMRDDAPEQVIPAGKPLAFFAALANGVAFGQQEYIFNKVGANKQRTICIDRLKASATDFDMSTEKKDELIASGKRSVRTFFNALPEKNASSYGNKPVNNGSLFPPPAPTQPRVVPADNKEESRCCVVS